LFVPNSPDSTAESLNYLKQVIATEKAVAINLALTVLYVPKSGADCLMCAEIER